MTDYTKLIDDVIDYNASDERPRASLQAAIEALQAENERLKRELEISKLDAKEWYSQADALKAKLDELQRQEPVGFISAECMSKLQDPEWQELRGEPLNLWTVNNPPSRAKTPLYAAPKALAPTTWQPASNPPPESAGEVLVRMADGRCEIAWPTYWHGSSNAFAQWTFRDPDEDEQPVEWMTIPAHGIGGTP